MWGVLMMDWCEKQAILVQFSSVCKKFALVHHCCNFCSALHACVPIAAGYRIGEVVAVFHAGEQQLSTEVE
jgi:hypothetical protein